MAEDSIFDSGLGGILDESLGSKRASEWENDFLGSLSDSELADLMSDSADSVGTVRMASGGDIPAPSGAKRAGVDGHNVIDDIADLTSGLTAAAAIEDMSKFVTASLYEGNSPKQIVDMLRIMHPAGQVDAFLEANSGEMMSKYGKLGFLYIDAADFRDDDQMDDMLGGQKKIGQMALETIKPADRCGDCTLNKSGFCMRYNLRLDENPSVHGARQARRILNKFAQRTLAGDQEMLEAQATVDAMERRDAPPEEYEKAVSAFLTKIGRPGRAAKKGDIGRTRLSGESDDSVRPTPSSDTAVEDFVRMKLAKKGDTTFAEMRGAAMASLGARRAKAWFRSNRSLAVRLMEAASRGEIIDREKDRGEQGMDHVRRAMVARYGQERAERIILATGGDPSKYTELLSRAVNTETRRIDTGKQMPREMPHGEQSALVGRLDDELRAAATTAAARGVPEDGVRENLSASFGNTRLAAFEDDCPGEIAGMVQRAAAGFGAADEDGFRLFEESLEEGKGDVKIAIAALRRKLGRRRTRCLIAEHPEVEAVVSASSRTHGQAANTAADRRIGGTASTARTLRPDTPLDFEALARQVLAAAEPELLASAMPRSAVDPTLVAGPEMGEVGLDYAEDHADIPDPIL